jgi:hypothetical protein
MRTLRIVGALWGLAGVVVLLGSAILRLLPKVVDPVRAGELEPLHWAALVAFSLLNAHAEGYRGFQKGFSPRTVARVQWLAHHGTPVQCLLAPFFCMALLGARRRCLVVAWSVFVGVTCLVLLVRGLPAPWRAVVDAGVIVGLGWGLVALVAFALVALRGRPMPVDPCVG